MSEFWSGLLGSVVGGSALLVIGGILLFLVRAWLGEYVKQSMAHDFNLELEQYRDDVGRLSTQLNAVQSAANSVLIEGQRASAEWRAQAVDKLWREVLGIQNVANRVGVLCDLTEPWKRRSDKDIQRFRELIGPSLLESPDSSDQFFSPIADEIRPFIGERLYVSFFWYRALLGRIIIFVHEDAKEGQFRPWFMDEGIIQGLESALTREEMQQFRKLERQHFGWLVDCLQGKMLTVLRHVVSGQVATEEGLENAQDVWRSIRAFQQVADYPPIV